MLPLINASQIAAVKYFGVTREELAQPTRGREPLPIVRQMAMAAVRDISRRNLSLPRIGQSFGGRHHTTVLHAEQLVRKLARDDKDFAASFEKFKRLVVDEWAALQSVDR